MHNLAIIPARGGSKRIPRKNIRNFLGKPVIAYSIELALKSGLFSEVMISTDDLEIADIAKAYGAKVPFFRSLKTSDDYSTITDVIDEVFHYYNNTNQCFDYACCLLPTSPLMTLEILKTGFDLLIEKKADSVRPVVRFSYPIQRALKMANGKTELLYPEYANTRSQDLDPAFHDSGQFYWMKFNNGLHGINSFGFEIPETLVQDIDNEQDWLIAELKYKLFIDPSKA